MIDKFGAYIDSLASSNPEKAREMLILAFKALRIRFKYFPQRQLSPARKHLSVSLMDAIISPYLNPESSALVSFFTPCEMLHTMGIYPQVAEAISGGINAAAAEKFFIEHAENIGISETYCSYHKIMIGSILSGVIPKPTLIACTSLACDANNLSFPLIAQHWNIPYFFIDVPVDRNPDSIAFVADQLKEFRSFLQDTTGKILDEERLKNTLASTEYTLKNLLRAQQLKKDRYLNNSLRSELFEIFSSHIMLGTSDLETYAKLLCHDLERSDYTKGVRILWMHVIPYYIEPLVKLMSFNPRCQIITCEMNYDVCTDIDPEKPYESMAKRLVFHPFNGSYTYRLESSLKMCKELNIDGVIYFCHWGCKQTAGIAACMKESLEAAGYPMLILGGDACDRNNGGEGQLMTRIEAFVEMLEESKLT